MNHVVNGRARVNPQPGYFLVRTTGQIVPLIAVDELPIGCDLNGVPRKIDKLEDTVGMHNLGLKEPTGSFYQLIQSTDIHALNYQSVKQPSTPSLTSDSTASSPSDSTPPTPPLPNVAPISATPATGTSCRAIAPLPPSRHPNLIGQPQSQLCRHWCTHGNCKWGQQCHYKHTMPMTLIGLQEIGLGDWPPWFRALNPGFFVNLKGNAGFHTMSSGSIANGGAGFGGNGVGVGGPGARPGQGLQYQIPMGEVPKRIGKGRKTGPVMINGHGSGHNSSLTSGPSNDLPTNNTHAILYKHASPSTTPSALVSLTPHQTLQITPQAKSSAAIQPAPAPREVCDSGKQIMERLKDLHTQREREAIQREREQKMQRMNMMLEKSVHRETRRWEDESEDEGEKDGEGKQAMVGVVHRTAVGKEGNEGVLIDV